MVRQLTMIGAPSSAGAYAPGQEQAPAAFRQFGLVEALRSRGVDVTDAGDTAGFRWRPDHTNPTTPNLAVVVEIARAVAELVARAMTGPAANAVLVLGGDCTVGMGTVAGMVGTRESVGLIYVDGDVDLNVPATGDGPLDWMGVAHILNVEGAADQLAGLGPRRPLLDPAAVLFVAPSNITPPEQALIDRFGMRVLPYDDVAADPEQAARQAVEWAQDFDRIAVHLDTDVLRYLSLPMAEGTADDRRPGLEPAALAVVMGAIYALPNWRGVTVTEVNPDHAPDPAVTLGEFIELLASAIAGPAEPA